jgi:hypothetical protein
MVRVRACFFLGHLREACFGYNPHVQFALPGTRMNRRRLATSLVLLVACSAHQTPPPVAAPSEKVAPQEVAPTARTAPSAALETAPAIATSTFTGASAASAPAVAPQVSVAAGPGWSIVTTAPEGITAADLGRVFDSAFQPLAGCRPLFKATASENYPVFRHSVSLVEDAVTLAATVRSWGLTADAGRSRRFASYRAEQIAEIHAVDDMTTPEATPPLAQFYLAKVYYGRSFEVRLSGEEKQFNSNLAGTFLSGKLDGGIKSFAERHRLEFTAVGRGLRPKSGMAIYAKQPSEIEDNYTVDGSVAVPVEVEYRLIPGRQLPTITPIVWRKQSRYRIELSAVEAHACDSTSACDLNVSLGRADSNEKPKLYRGPDDADLWEPRYMLLETTDENELGQGWNVEVSDRNLTLSRVLGRCQVRVDQRRIRSVNEAPDHRHRWTELCGNAQVRLTLTSEDVN